MRLKTRTDETGFTLLELLIVITIVGILITVVVPAYREQRKLAVDARTISDVRAVANQVYDAMIACEDADVFDFVNVRDGVDVNKNLGRTDLVTNTLSYRHADGTIRGPFETYHTLSYDHWKNNQDKSAIRIYNIDHNDKHCVANKIRLSEGTNLHIFPRGYNYQNLFGQFMLYGWNPDGKKYDGRTVTINQNYANLTEAERKSVVTFDSQLGGVMKQP